jgi:hypothetical protein
MGVEKIVVQVNQLIEKQQSEASNILSPMQKMKTFFGRSIALALIQTKSDMMK